MKESKIDIVFRIIFSILGLIFITTLFYMSFYHIEKIYDRLEELENKVEVLEKEKNEYEEIANTWYENYIELGITCGANE